MKKTTTGNHLPHGPSTARVARAVARVRLRGLEDRSGEWFERGMFPEIGAQHPDKPVIVRRALGFQAMLEAMTDPANSRRTGTGEIREGELLVGTIPMGSVGLGKEFPRYMTEEEVRLSSMTSRDEESMFGHNIPDMSRVLSRGLRWMIDFSTARIDSLKHDADPGSPLGQMVLKKTSFYSAVVICCRAVIDYANRFAELAEKEAAAQEPGPRQEELRKIALVCRRVPEFPAESFEQAVQAVWFIHLALHSTMNLMSPGRLDQVLEPYYQASLKKGEISRDQALELLECYFVKGAERLNLTTNWLLGQDHLDFGTGLGTSPIFLDQVASANNFLQNITVSGLDREGRDATNECSYLIIEACRNVGLPTPTLTVRLHRDSPKRLLDAVADALLHGGNSLPIIYNDDAIVPGFVGSGVPVAQARDYGVDGCWEPILNGTCDWTFGMVNMLTAMECALNQGALLTGNNPSLLRGRKMSYATTAPSRMKTFDDLLAALEDQIRFFTDKVGLSIYDFYTIDGSATPTPFFSAMLGSCLEKGLDKTWGSADFNLGGIVSLAVPNCANALVNIEELVFIRKELSLEDLILALRTNFQGQDGLRKKLLDGPKFGNNEARVDELAAWVMTAFRRAVDSTHELARKIFLDQPQDPGERVRIQALRNLAGYDGDGMRARYGKDFDILFTAGSGTFGQYVSMGQGVAASADGRGANEPVVPNCSPASGTIKNGLGSVLTSMGKLGMDRFAAGVMLDVCLEPGVDDGMIRAVLQDFVEQQASIMSVSMASREVLTAAFDACEQVRKGLEPPSSLEEYAWLSVRVGGWNAPFISLPREQQLDYLKRHLDQISR